MNMVEFLTRLLAPGAGDVRPVLESRGPEMIVNRESVGHDHCARLHIIPNEQLDALAIDRLHATKTHSSKFLFCLALHRHKDRCLALRPTPAGSLPLAAHAFHVSVSLLLLKTSIGLMNASAIAYDGGVTNCSCPRLSVRLFAATAVAADRASSRSSPIETRYSVRATLAKYLDIKILCKGDRLLSVHEEGRAAWKRSQLREPSSNLTATR